MTTVVPCSACKDTPQYQARCRECRGVGYFETFEILPGCTGEQPVCPVFFDPGVCGWECKHCKRSGPAYD